MDLRAGYRRDWHEGFDILVSTSANFYGDDEIITIGQGSRIDDFVVISGRVSIGLDVHIGPHCSLHGGPAGITIGNGAAIAAGSRIYAISDDYTSTGLFGPEMADDLKAPNTSQRVAIGDHCIIGAGCVVLPGTTVGNHSAIGALSMVVGTIQPGRVMVGAPLREVRRRDLPALQALAETYDQRRQS